MRAGDFSALPLPLTGAKSDHLARMIHGYAVAGSGRDRLTWRSSKTQTRRSVPGHQGSGWATADRAPVHPVHRAPRGAVRCAGRVRGRSPLVDSLCLTNPLRLIYRPGLRAYRARAVHGDRSTSGRRRTPSSKFRFKSRTTTLGRLNHLTVRGPRSDRERRAAASPRYELRWKSRHWGGDETGAGSEKASRTGSQLRFCGASHGPL